MGSMIEVMKKVRESQEAERPTPAALPDSSAPGAFSRFDPEEPPREGGGVDPRTETWDARAIDPAIVAFHDRYSPICEQFRSVRARLLALTGATAHRVITVTSSLPREGKTVCALNLGLVLAEGGEHSVLVCDADFRHPTLGRLLGLPALPGLAELVRTQAPLADVLRPTPFPNLKILLSGDLAGQSVPDFLGLPGLREVLARLRASFHYTLLDAPPINTVTDASYLGPACDGVLLTLAMHRTPVPAAERAVRTLQANNIQILGCLLTYHDDSRTNGDERTYH